MINANLTFKNNIESTHINLPTLKELTVHIISIIHAPTKIIHTSLYSTCSLGDVIL